MSTAAPPRRADGRSFAYAGWHYRFPPRYRVIWGALAILLVAILVLAPEALNAASLRIETPLISILAIASLGQLVVVMIGGFDLSVAAVMSFSSALLLTFTDGGNDKLLVGLVIVLAACAGIGAVNGLLAGPAGLNPLIVTLAMGGVVSAVALLITDEGARVINTTIPSDLSDVATGYVGRFSNLIFAAIVVVIVVAFVLRRTTIGRRFVSAGANPTAARIVGVPIARYQVGAYACAGLLYGLAGVLLAGFVERPNLTLGDPYLLSTFIVVALGGVLFTGGPASVASAAGGAVFLTLLIHFLAIEGLSAGAQSLIQGVVLVVAVALVTGLSGRGRGRGSDAPDGQPSSSHPITEGGEGVHDAR